MIRLLRSVLSILYMAKRFVSYIVVFSVGVAVGLSGLSVDPLVDWIGTLNFL